MAERRPLVRIAGVTKELPAGDTVAGKQTLVFSCVGKPGAGEVLGAFVADVPFTIYANLAGSILRALAAATGSSAVTLTQIPAGSATETVVATATIAAGGTLATFSTQAAISVGLGDMLRCKGPATQDGTLADFTWTIVGYR